MRGTPANIAAIAEGVRAGLSQADIAKRLGLQRSTVSERVNSHPMLVTLWRDCAHLRQPTNAAAIQAKQASATRNDAAILAGIKAGSSLTEIGAAIGRDADHVRYRIREVPELKDAWRVADDARKAIRIAAGKLAAKNAKAGLGKARERARAAKRAELERVEAARRGTLIAMLLKGSTYNEIVATSGMGWKRLRWYRKHDAEVIAADEAGRDERENARNEAWRAHLPAGNAEGVRKARLQYVANQRERKRKGLKHGAIGKAVAAPIPQADCTLAGRCCDYLKRIYTPAYHRVIHGKEHAGTYQVGGLTLSEADMIALAMRKGFGERIAA